LLNTATGIKYFGLFQVLSQNNYLTENTILILDEPENHLHPKWQLKMAEVIVELVKNGVKVLVNSHSPYMVEALKRYSEVEKIEEKTNFYLAEEGYIKKINDSNSETLVAIYEKLSEPYDVFEQMESDRFTNG
jgi:predicted ATPase